MNHDNSQQPQQPGAIPEWFTPVSPSTTSSPTPRTPKKSPRLAIIIGGIIILLVATTAIALTFGHQESTCLNVSDYKALTGVESTSDISPTDTFYTDYALFKNATVAYDTTTDGGQHGEALIQKIADFYKTHMNKPLTISISGTYFTADAESLANQRIDAVQSSLLKAGVPQGIIAVAGASYIAPEDALEGDGDTGEVTISITSDPTCRP